MAITVSDVLGLEVFRQGQADVVAGSSHLGRVVRWVHISELPDIARLLKGGELLLTTGMGLAGDAALQRAYLRDLSAAGVAGVVVEIGRTFSELPKALIDEAERCGVPLIALRKETRYIEVTEQVHAAIISRQYEMLQKAERIGRDFTNLVLAGAGPKQIVNHLASIAHNPVVLEDRAHQVVEFAPYGSPIDDILGRWEAHSRAGHDGPAGAPANGTTACAWTPVTARAEAWGLLHLLEVDRAIDESDRVALDRAGAALSLSLLAERDAAHLAEGARGALIAEILQSPYVAPQKILDRSRSLGVDLSGKQLAALVVEPAVGADDPGARARALDETRQAIARARCVGLSSPLGDRVMAVVGVAEGADATRVLDEIGQTIARGAWLVGVGGPVAADGLHRALEEAREAVRYGLTMGRGSGVYRYGDLGLHQLLLRLADGPDLARFVESELGRLLDHDARSSAPLLPTLRCYLDHDGRKTESAKALGIERRSIYHRIERIRRLLREDLDDPEVRTRLAVALRGLDVLRRRRHALRQLSPDRGTL